MLQVKIQYNEGNERLFYINDILDVKRVMDNILEDFQRVLAQDASDNRVDLERVLEASPFDNPDNLIDWLNEIAELTMGDHTAIRDWAEISDQLDRMGYDNVEEMADRIDRLQSSINDIFYTAKEMAD